MAGNDDLHPILKSINKSISKLVTEVQTVAGEVQKIQEVLQKGFQSVRDAIHENIQAQAELKLMEHVMEVRSVIPQIEAEHEQIRTEQSELDERLNNIDERYQNKHDELDEKARKRVRDLGSHIFEIDEEQFEAGIERPFTEQVTTTWKHLREHNDAVREERGDRLEGTADDVARTIDDFVERQDALVDSIDNHRLDIDGVSADDEVERLQVPYYVVEYEQDGVTERQLVAPSRVSLTDEGWCSAELTPIEGSEALLADADGVSDDGRRQTVSTGVLTDVLAEYGEETSFGLSYATEVEKTLPDDDLPVRVEGGGR